MCEVFVVSNVSVRHIVPDDYPVIIAVLDEWWGGRAMRAMLPKLFFVHFQPTSFTATHDDALIGFVVAFVSQTDPNEAYIHFVGVHPRYRALGVGRLLYEQVIVAAVERGCTRLRCVTAPTNTRSIAFHQRLGFAMVPSGVQQGEVFVHPAYDGPGEDRVVFVKTLE